jgi:acyl carrier protein
VAPAAAPAAPTPAPVETAAETPVLTLPATTERLLELVSGLTGYPPEMLNLDLNLEADLGIDSIKRVEIFAALQNAFALPAGESGSVEVFSQLNTLRKIAEWVHARRPAPASHPSKPPCRSRPRYPLSDRLPSSRPPRKLLLACW